MLSYKWQGLAEGYAFEINLQDMETEEILSDSVNMKTPRAVPYACESHGIRNREPVNMQKRARRFMGMISSGVPCIYGLSYTYRKDSRPAFHFVLELKKQAAPVSVSCGSWPRIGTYGA